MFKLGEPQTMQKEYDEREAYFGWKSLVQTANSLQGCQVALLRFIGIGR